MRNHFVANTVKDLIIKIGTYEGIYRNDYTSYLNMQRVIVERFNFKPNPNTNKFEATRKV